MKRSLLPLLMIAVIGNQTLLKNADFAQFLVKMDGITLAHAEEAAASEFAQDRKVLYWYDPMVPGKKFDKPGKSPYMDMELLPKYTDEPETAPSGGKPIVSIPDENIQKMGVRAEKVS